jgi:hypothetical protein
MQGKVHYNHQERTMSSPLSNMTPAKAAAILATKDTIDAGHGSISKFHFFFLIV